MAKTTLTQLAVDRLKPPATSRVEVFDRTLPGFGLRLSATGTKSWFVFFRVGNVQRRQTLGSLTDIPLVADARRLARQALDNAASGIDPSPVRQTRPADTVAAVVDQFITRYAKPRNRSWAGTDGILRRDVIPAWGLRDVQSITRRDVIVRLDEVVDSGRPGSANHLLSAVRKMFNWCVERGVIEANPCAGVRAPSPNHVRDRVLSDDELARIWVAAGTEAGTLGAFISTLILSLQRRSEVAAMRWQDVDLVARTWTLSAEQTKAKRRHVVPLSELLLAVLTSIPRTGTFMFTQLRGESALSGFSKLKERIDRLSGVTDWTLHDLRRTGATGLAKLKISPPVIGRVLNHAPEGVTARVYNHYDYAPEMQDALDVWASHVDRLNGEPK
jgi:integrase